MNEFASAQAAIDQVAPHLVTLPQEPPEPRLPDEVTTSLVNRIRELHRQRDDLVRAEGDMTRRIKSICRRAAKCDPTDDPATTKAKMALATRMYEAVEAGDFASHAVAVLHTLHLLTCRNTITKALTDVEKELLRNAKRLHVADFVESTRAFGYLGLAQIIGEAGDLNEYANPAKLWKRFGLGLISTGERQRKFTEEAKYLEAGYSPRRRSLMYVIGDSLVKGQVRKDKEDPDKRTSLGPLGQIYLDRKAYEVARNPEIKPIVAHRRAQRYMEKRLLRDLWRAWRRQEGDGA